MTNELQKLFLEIRDIPYKLRFSADEEDFSCDGKHRKLADRLAALGYEVRWRTALYKWESLPIPKNILKLDVNEYWLHSFLEVFIGSNWVKLDATWDKELGRILPINDWDGKSDTKIAVPYIGDLYSPEESLETIKKPRDKERINESLSRRERFHMALNEYFDKIRKES